jgi:hypothetical protein
MDRINSGERTTNIITNIITISMAHVFVKFKIPCYAAVLALL